MDDDPAFINSGTGLIAFLACLTPQERKVFDEALVKLSTLARALVASEQTVPIARVSARR